MRSSALLPFLSALTSLSSAHFLVNFPRSIGFKDDDEGTSPCGGFTPNLSDASSLVDFHVGGEAVSVRLTHTQGNWLFRATTDPKAESGWEQIFPIVMQSGLGDFCQPQITLPQKFVGQKGVVGIVSDAADGLLYQCIAANFVSGSASIPSACKNATIKVSFADDAKLSALLGNGSDSSSTASQTSGGSSASSTKTSAATATTSTANAASSLQSAWSTTAVSLGHVVTVLSMALIGGALMA